MAQAHRAGADGIDPTGEHSTMTTNAAGAGAGALKVAVTTQGDNQINQHFGHADAFAIYTVDPQVVHPLEIREAAHYCQGGYGDEDKREVILRTLADCCALFTARIGEGPRARLAEAGIEAVDDYPYGLIEPAIRDWFDLRG
jgi:nitrogen fixation protein NifB